MTRRAVLVASLAAFTAAISIAVSGGFATSVGGVRLSARSWQLPVFAALVLLAGWLNSSWRAGRIAADLAWLDSRIESQGRRLALAASVCALVAALSFGTYSPSGADASGYVSQAAMWSRLEWRIPDPLVVLPDWPLPAAATAPLGWRPALEQGWLVPTYAAGLPWLMALPHALAGIAGAQWVVAIAAGLAVGATAALAWQVAGGIAALLAAVLIATSPTFLIHTFQPMSDVPVTAAWALCWWFVAREQPAAAGLAAAIALVIRPNLAPLAAVPWLVVMVRAQRTDTWRAARRFAIPVAIAGGLIAWMQWHWYGSPLTSGYGSPGELFTVSNVTPNARLYAGWLWQAEPAIVLAIAAALVVGLSLSRATEKGGGDGVALPLAGLLTFSAGVIGAYLVYAVFEVWTYLRFLLPALVVLVSLSAATLTMALRRMPAEARGVVAIALVLAVAATGVQRARTLGVFQVAAVTARAKEAGAVLDGRLGGRSVLLAGEQSGSIRYMTGRPIVRWDALDKTSLSATLTLLEARGYDVWWVLDQFEESLVRSRFAGVPEAALDSAPDVEAGPLMRTRAWRVKRRPADN